MKLHSTHNKRKSVTAERFTETLEIYKYMESIFKYVQQ